MFHLQANALGDLVPGLLVANHDGMQLVPSAGARQLPPRGQNGMQELGAVALAPVRGLDEDLGLGPAGARHVLAVGQAALAHHLARGKEEGAKVPVVPFLAGFLQPLNVVTRLVEVAIWSASCCCCTWVGSCCCW